MKTNPISVSLILLSIFIILSSSRCNNQPKPPSKGCITCYSPKCDTVFNGYSAQFIHDLILNYRLNQWTTINNGMGTNGTNKLGSNHVVDSRSVWFSLDSIKRFIYEIESNVCSNCDNAIKPKLGIRLYYGQYNPAVITAPNYYDGLHTAIMIPTISDVSGINVDFDPHKMTNCDPTDIDCDSAAIVALLPNINISSMNHGTLIPPPNGTSYSGALLMQCIDQMHPFIWPTSTNNSKLNLSKSTRITNK